MGLKVTDYSGDRQATEKLTSVFAGTADTLDSDSSSSLIILTTLSIDGRS